MSTCGSLVDLPDDIGFATYFNHLYERHLNTDVDFDILGPDGPVTFSAHRFVLSLWSPYFADMLYVGDQNIQNSVNILQYNDVNPEIFKDMMKFMYGNCPEFGNHKKACELYKVAIKFEVKSLMQSCREYLNRRAVDVSNVFDILDASKYMKNKSRTDSCLNLIQENTKEVMKAYALSDISPSILHTLLDLPKISLTGEYELLKWVFAWGEIESVNNPLYNSGREALKPFLKKLNFLALTNQEFALLVKMNDEFFSEREMLAIFMNIGERGSWEMPVWYDENQPFRTYN